MPSDGSVNRPGPADADPSVGLVSGHERPPAQPTASDASKRVVKVMMLGFSESGKTVYLASMWRYFRGGTPDGIAFRTDDEATALLDDYCTGITGGNFPPPTAVLKEWNFTVQARGISGQMVDAFTLTYVDYEGRDLDRLSGTLGRANSDRPEPPDVRIKQAIDRYDIIMGMLDGAKIAAVMRDDNSDPEYGQWLDKLFGFIFKHPNKTVHLVLTKYDLLENFSLEAIAAKLRDRYFSFRQFQDSLRIGEARLIPIFPLGPRKNGFVRADDDGTTVLDRRRNWVPESVERPLVCTLPDALGAELEKVRRVAPGYRPSPRSALLRWENYSPILCSVASAFTGEVPIIQTGTIDLSVAATGAALFHLAKLLNAEDSRVPGSRLPWRRPAPISASTDSAKALEHVIETWARNARVFDERREILRLNTRQSGDQR